MKKIKKLIRFLQINIVFLHYALYRFIKDRNEGEALRHTLEKLGPIFIKFGQALSTRPDLLPVDIAAELSKLQDNVPPFPTKIAIHHIEQAFKQPIVDLFKSFDPIPLASASMAQVHAATLPSGEDVVVKILRPGLKKILRKDLELLESLAHWITRYWPSSRQFKPIEIVKEFKHTLMNELDLEREAANASQLKRNFKHSPLLHVPTIYWNYVKRNVFVMERIYGIPVNNIEQLKAAGIDLKQLAKNGLTLFFTQVFRDCFFHADMHPGNIFVSPQLNPCPQYICVDFGIMGSLNEKDKQYIARNLLAFFQRDYRRVAELHIQSGWVANTLRIDEFESAIRTVCEPIFEKPLKDISFATLILRLFQVARRFHIRIQPQLMLLQKTLFSIEGLGRQLDPDLDLWATAKPFLEEWVKTQLSPKIFWRHLKENAPFLLEQLPALPGLMHDVLSLKKESLEHKKHLPPKKPQRTAPSIKCLVSFGCGMLFFYFIVLFTS